MSASKQPEGFRTDAELQAHLAALEADAPAEEGFQSPDDYMGAERRRLDELKSEIASLRDEMENLRMRLSAVAQQATTVVRSNIDWADASAHAQLGRYPWAKLAGAMAATFVSVRLLKRLPLGKIARVAIPLMITWPDERSR
ncbi:hypothetical protein [Rhizobium leucaenae]|uniref:Uncharacterized protein n=1 Tax=Rhizobium leucaenae TaxID=29450 RepID=A0A7W6ZXW7_9HYPH|nr:hypothetical protein [Rhizobium leucaenae]MBB4570756.1 hypothetical protein [Rhizobium leucaenae]MBB6303703.1 hypothetical protein [Rhizobium leucaenae]